MTQALFKSLSFKPATARDAAGLAALHNAAAEHLTRRHGQGPWSYKSSGQGMRLALRTSLAFVARDGKEIIATLRLATKRPWAIDARYFTPCKKPLYLIGMAVAPDRQRQGIGRWCLEQALAAAKIWPGDAIRLDAFDAQAGAGGFYASCGYREMGRAKYRNSPLIYYELLIPPK